MSIVINKAPAVTNLTVDGDDVTKTTLGLGSVDNTSDADKPISDDTQDALDLKADIDAVVALADATDFCFTPCSLSLTPAESSFIVANDNDTYIEKSLADTKTLLGLSDKRNNAFVADEATDWTDDTSPANIQDALDQLAARLKILEDA